MKRSITPTAAGAAVLALLAAGCGSSDADGAQEQGEVRTVTDATGSEVEVPETPERIVTLHYAATQPVLDLGFTPVGQGQFEEGIIPEDQAAEVEEIPVVADGVEPRLEEIAELEPDLVLAPNVLEEEVHEQLAAVAPVYTFTLRGDDREHWPQRTEEVADALGVPEQPEELAAELETRQEEIAEEYADEIEGRTVTVLSSYEENSVYVWGENNMTGSLLLPLGFTWSEQANAAVEDEDEAEATLSGESLASAADDADLVFYDTNLRAEPNAFMEDLQGTALYQDLPAVQDGHAYPAGKSTVAGYTDAHYTLDLVEEALEDLREG
ncbi:ABC transporter substrate-binding protein [Nocardiopsis sp. HNM0947]|uniref:ABC transporter substrate-binding protein n=1 Tax=Nocardiopsis coralli TaxID=2772213 RepID=A0ABR9PAE7_9ACTN|nr:ABC transporter substrate-binding protein [Nocardiopsis coralli]MBE3000809.1 ABC transporter substrate-binding protein [Nocardiopsis coralli]